MQNIVQGVPTGEHLETICKPVLVNNRGGFQCIGWDRVSMISTIIAEEYGRLSQLSSLLSSLGGHKEICHDAQR
jgi:hypothetical protein